MNTFDKMISYVAPMAALKRETARQALKVMNYQNGGASHTKRSMRAWKASANSATTDIDQNLSTLIARSRDLYMNAPIATSAIKTARTNVVGPGLKLKAHLDVSLLGLSESEGDQWERKVEREFALWSKTKLCDRLRMADFFDLQSTAFMGHLLNGDSFCLFQKDKKADYMPYTLRLYVIEADRISTPTNSIGNGVVGVNPSNTNPIYSGVEVDKTTSQTVAYWVSSVDEKLRRSWQRIDAFGKETGMPNILHLIRQERAEQRRGVPYLAPVIETLKQLTRYTEAELMASIISGMFTVFIKTNAPTTENQLGEMIPEEERVDKTDSTYEMAPGAINVLGKDESIELANPTRPATSFDAFVTSLTRYIGAALEIPQELLLKSFNASYSASRASLLEAWKFFNTSREWLAKEFCQPVYEQWLSEAVAIGRINAPGFFVDPAIRKAWCSTEWHGSSQGQIDPLKEVKAAQLRVALGVSTRERESIEMTGSNFDQNVAQLKREEKLMGDLIYNPSEGGDTDGGNSGDKQE
jgi:lambda family phage portal protein